MSSLNKRKLCLIGAAVAIRAKRERRKQKNRDIWVKDWLLKREALSHTNLFRELLLEGSDWHNYLRMDQTTYFELLSLLTPFIQHSDTVMRKAITPHERLTATLRYIATGCSYENLKFSTVVSAQALGKIIPETCKAIYKALAKEYMKFPTSEDEWKEIAEQFQEKWQFPHALGAVDGKHVRIQPPPGSGSYYYNYKQFHSVVLLGIANANYEFILCDISTNGRVSDGGVLDNTDFGKALSNGTLHLPADKSPEGCQTALPYVFIGDEAFSLGSHFLIPFSQNSLNYQRLIFNYRLSRARRIIENVFGILSARFRIFGTAINLSIKHIEDVVMACAILHNFLRRKCPTAYTPDNNLYHENTTHGDINSGLSADSESLLQLQIGQNRNVNKSAKEIRDLFLNYFNNEGAVEWQDNMVKNN